MSLFVLDTDLLTLLEESHPAVGSHFIQHPPGEVAITILSVEEQLSGWYSQVRKAKRPDHSACYSVSTNKAAPWPPPTHNVAKPRRRLRRRSSLSSVNTIRVPVAPTG